MHRVSNREIAKLLGEVAIRLDIENVAFKPRAYERAAYAVGGLSEEVAEVYARGGVKALMDIPGVGRGIADHLEELLRTGSVADYERLRKKYPVRIDELSAIEGVGPQTIKVLWQKLKVRNARDLERLARAGALRSLPRFGEKLEAKILKGIEFQKRAKGRFLLGEVRPFVETITERLRGLKEVRALLVCGSYRRWQETVGDIDILVTSKKPGAVMDFFASMPEVEHIYARGLSKTLVRLRAGIDADLRVVPPASFGAAVQYFTGDKRHNVKMREIAVKRGYKLNEYGLFRGRKIIAAESEEDIYRKLGLAWIPPEMRADAGEIEAAQKGVLPKVIGYGELRGDLQVTTNWTDGAHSIEEMAAEAARRGLVVSFCLHSNTSFIAA